MTDGKQLLIEFEDMLALAEARAYSKLSLERPLTDDEFRKYKAVMERVMKQKLEV